MGEQRLKRLPREEWTAIAAKYTNGDTLSKIAREYGLTPSQVAVIVRKECQPRQAFPTPSGEVPNG